MIALSNLKNLKKVSTNLSSRRNEEKEIEKKTFLAF